MRSVTLPILDGGPSARQRAARQLREQLDEALRLLHADEDYSRKLLHCARKGDAARLGQLLHDGPFPNPLTMSYGHHVPHPSISHRPVPKCLRPDLDGLLETMCAGIVETGPRCYSQIPQAYIETLHVLITEGCRDRTINGLPLHTAIMKAWGNEKRCGAVERLLRFIERWTDGPVERERLSAADGARLLKMDTTKLRYEIKKHRIPAETVNGRNTYRRSDLESLVVQRCPQERRGRAFDDLVRGMSKNVRGLLKAYETVRRRQD